MAMLSGRGEWIEVNDRLCRLLGFSERELIGKMWDELTFADDLPRETAQFTHLLDQSAGRYVMDKRFVCKDGKLLCVSLTVQAMRKNDGTLDCILVLVEDTSNRRQSLNGSH